MAKIQPAVLNLRYEIGQGNIRYIDLSQSASIVNRRFYRQGLNWAVAGFTVYAETGTTAVVELSKLPNTWVCGNAWHKAYAHWKDQQDDVLRDAGGQSAAAKFRDFKVHMNTNHVDVGFAANAVPIDLVKAAYSLGEWDASQIVLPNIQADAGGSDTLPQEYLLHIVGDNNHGGLSRGVIDGYASSRAYPQSPDPVGSDLSLSGNWLRQMDDVGNDNPEIIANAQEHNAELPYDQDDYPGADTNAPTCELVHRTFLNATTFHQVRKLAGTNVPCGLLQVDIAAESTGPVQVIVHLVPGEHRGYLCEPMQDM